VGRNRAGGVEVSHLGGGMHTGIGAAGGHRIAGAERIEGRDRLLKHLLHAALAVLPLPTVEGGAVVLETEGEATGRRLSASSGNSTGRRHGQGRKQADRPATLSGQTRMAAPGRLG
jgi:hypothetical protein